MSSLAAWENFYIIVGGSGGGLTGLLFVVITLIAGTREQYAMWGVGTFTTPTVVHFGSVLLAAAILSAPWPALGPPAVLLGLVGLGGMAYAALVVRRMLRPIGYQPVGEDWLWFAAAPLVVYTALLVAALLLPGTPTPALFGIGAVLLLLLFLGIHNAWDLVTYLAIERFTHAQPDEQGEQEKRDGVAEERTQ